MSSENPFHIPNEYSYLEYLSDKELETLDKLSKVSNNIKKDSEESKKLENMRLIDLYNQWSKTHIDIIKDLSKFTTKEYKKYFTDIDKTEQWWTGIVLISKYIFSILTKDGRIIYTGITIIVVAILMFFISSSR